MVEPIPQSARSERDQEYWGLLHRAVRVKGDLASLIAMRDARVHWFDDAVCAPQFNGELLPADSGALPKISKGKIPEIAADDLEIGVLACAMRRHGALIIRGLIEKPEAAVLRSMIQRTFEASEAEARRQPDGMGNVPAEDAEWFHPLVQEKRTREHVVFVRETGAIEMFMSPRTTDHLLTAFDRLGLRSLLRAYFSDEPCVSFKKSLLRRVSPLLSPADWHQDGAFMTADIKSLNLWVALTPCGEGMDAPGIDLVPKRLWEIVDPGVNGANFDWSVSAKTVREKFADTPPVRPTFNVGDAVFFDHFNLHSTSFGAEFTQKRYALETWFFATGRYPENQSAAYW